jgi:hypothetical protein
MHACTSAAAVDLGVKEVRRWRYKAFKGTARRCKEVDAKRNAVV